MGPEATKTLTMQGAAVAALSTMIYAWSPLLQRWLGVDVASELVTAVCATFGAIGTVMTIWGIRRRMATAQAPQAASEEPKSYAEVTE